MSEGATAGRRTCCTSYSRLSSRTSMSSTCSCMNCCRAARLLLPASALSTCPHPDFYVKNLVKSWTSACLTDSRRICVKVSACRARTAQSK